VREAVRGSRMASIWERMVVQVEESRHADANSVDLALRAVLVLLTPSIAADLRLEAMSWRVSSMMVWNLRT